MVVGSPVVPEKATGMLTQTRNRLGELDLLRGTIMIVMAWDHCKDNIAKRLPADDKGSQMWSGPFATFDQDFG